MGASIFTVQSQSIAYYYDQAGNRIARRVIVVTNPSQIVKHNPGTKDSTVVKDMLGEQTVVIYPNPTRGMLGVEITGGKAEEKMTIAVLTERELE